MTDSGAHIINMGLSVFREKLGLNGLMNLV